MGNINKVKLYLSYFLFNGFMKQGVNKSMVDNKESLETIISANICN